MKLFLGLMILKFSFLLVSNYRISDSRGKTFRDLISYPRDQVLSDINHDPSTSEVRDVYNGGQQASVENEIKRAQQLGEPSPLKNHGGEIGQNPVAKGSLFDRHPEILEVITADSPLEVSNDIVTDVLSTFKSFKNPKKRDPKTWSQGTFKKALKELGVYNNKGLKVVKLKKAEISELKGTKNRMKTVKATRPRIRERPKRPESDPHKRSSGSYDLCAEYVDSIYALAHESSQLAYQIESVRCEGVCNSSTYKLELGTCNLATKTTIVYTIDSSGNFQPKTIEPGCACECLNYYQ